MNKLEEYVNRHRHDFDTVEPSANLWQNIAGGLKAPAPVAAKPTWLKYFIPGTCVVALLAVVAAVTINNEAVVPVATHKVISAETPLETRLPQTEIPQEQHISGQPSHSPAATNSVLPVVKNQPADTFLTPTPVTLPVNALANSPAVPSVYAGPAYTKGGWNIKGATFNVDTVFEGIKKIVVNSSSFDVKIHSHTGNNLLLKASMSKTEKGFLIGTDTYKITYLKKDSVLLVSVECTSRARLVMGSLTKKAELDFEVPRATNVVVSNTYGNISAKDLYGAQCVIKAESGDIRLENINTGVVVDAGYGNITAFDIHGFLTAASRSGDLSVCDLTGNITVKTSYGNQSYKNITGNVVCTGTSGDVKIDGMQGNAFITASYGNVTLDNYNGSPTVDASSGDIRGRQVQLTGNALLTTKYGNIKMDLLNDLNTLSFNLKTNYGKITVDNGSEKRSDEKQLTITTGTILVKGFTNSGDQYYK